MSNPPVQVVQLGTSSRKPYRPPQLTVFGPLSKLTQNGTGAIGENKGQGFCGAGYNAKGSKTC